MCRIDIENLLEIDLPCAYATAVAAAAKRNGNRRFDVGPPQLHRE